MTSPAPDPKSFQSMVEWLESELRTVKAQLREYGDQAEQNQTQLWDVQEQQQRADHGGTNLAAQVELLTELPEQIRMLRERIDRAQGASGQDTEQRELFTRQLRAEMQAERDERGELRRRTEFAEQAAAGVTEKLGLVEDLTRRLQEEVALMVQRLEQADLNLSGIDARLAANAETQRRMQGDARTASQVQEELQRGFDDLRERVDQINDGLRRVQEAANRGAEMAEELEALRERFDAVRQSQDATMERANEMARDNEAMSARLTEMERHVQLARARGDQHERTLGELRHSVDEAADSSRKEAERFLALQEKVRRQQVSDLEQEIREIRGYGRTKAGPDA